MSGLSSHHTANHEASTDIQAAQQLLVHLASTAVILCSIAKQVAPCMIGAAGGIPELDFLCWALPSTIWGGAVALLAGHQSLLTAAAVQQRLKM
jgi:hypothetical protein